MNPWAAPTGEVNPALGSSSAAPPGLTGGPGPMLTKTPGEIAGGNASNPYGSLEAGINGVLSSESSLMNSGPGMQNALSLQSQGAQNFANQSAPYPTYPNAAGVGSQTAGQMMGEGGATSGMGAGTQMAALDASHGFSPWSLMGEAMTR